MVTVYLRSLERQHATTHHCFIITGQSSFSTFTCCSPCTTEFGKTARSFSAKIQIIELFDNMFYVCLHLYCICVYWLFWLISGHIHQVKENLSKTPQELIPAVFTNTWGAFTKHILTSKFHNFISLIKVIISKYELKYMVAGLPGAFQAALHGVLTAERFEQAIRDTMSCGGCTCSRGSFIGACLGAQVHLIWPFTYHI